MADFDLTAFYGQFRDETWESLDIVEQGLTALEAQPDDTALLDRMLRAIHTTKGSAKIMGFAKINRLAHLMEDVLGAIRKDDVKLVPEIGNILLQSSAAIRTLTDARVEGQEADIDVTELLQGLRQAAGGPEDQAEPAAAQEAAAPVVTTADRPASRPRETIRVDLERVDRLARLVGETLAIQQQAHGEKSTIQDLSAIQTEAQRALDYLKERLATCMYRLQPLQSEDISQTLLWIEATLGKLADEWRNYVRGHDVLLDKFSLTLDDLHQEALTIRMMPIGTIFELFPGVVRRMAGESGVEVNLEIRGTEVELDRRVLDLLRDPLIHLMRNALDHGIEAPEEREAKGKARRGLIVLEAWQRGRRVHIRIQDDGRGIDLEKVRRTVVQRGILDEAKARELGPMALLDHLFKPGFTTRKRVTDISGRGVGLDVVQTAVRQLNGLVQVETQVGQGTAFTLDVPLTLATIRVLLLEAAGETLALPATTIRSLLRVRPQEVVPVEGRPMLQWQEQMIPLVPLAGVLGLSSAASPAERRPTVIAGTNGRQVALSVDRVLDEAEVVVQPLGPILGKSPYFSAATLSGTGQVIPIIDVAGLRALETPITEARVQPTRVRLAARTVATILVVEDALTTRELQRSILEAAGYRVVTAIDGVDAMEKLEQQGFELVITDIEMPRMDGFELTEQLRQNPRWADLPVVIVTAREDEAGRRRGLQVGAQAYIVKSRFDQSNLLDTIVQLVG